MQGYEYIVLLLPHIMVSLHAGCGGQRSDVLRRSAVHTHYIIFYSGKNPQKGIPMKKIFSKISNILSNERGEGAFLDVVIIAVVVVVIGCLLMTLMKQLYSGTVFPKFKAYIESLFGYADSYAAGVGSGVTIN